VAICEKANKDIIQISRLNQIFKKRILGNEIYKSITFPDVQTKSFTTVILIRRSEFTKTIKN